MKQYNFTQWVMRNPSDLKRCPEFIKMEKVNRNFRFCSGCMNYTCRQYQEVVDEFMQISEADLKKIIQYL